MGQRGSTLRSTVVGCIAIVAVAIVAFVWLGSLGSRERAEEEALGRLPRVSAPASRAVDGGGRTQTSAGASRERLGTDSGNDDGARAPRRVLYLNDIDDIKHEIYAREIESLDRVHLLDDLVQTGDMDTRVLWDRDWSGVDDWKSEQNGFTLQRTEDGSLVFHPDQATMDLYTFYETLQAFEYDESTKEFVNEVDYYGKPIRNVLKFINEETLVMMTISGDKVDLNIYGEGAPQE